MSSKKFKVAVGMSGGVDSSVAAALLKDQGYDVIGIFMHFWTDPHYAEKQTIANKCCSVDAKVDARRVAEKLGIPLYTLNLDQDFKEYIVNNFLDQYKQGLTPNPCVRCNQFIKFGKFWEKAQSLGCDFIATGHYVRVKDGHLFEAEDKDKDQTYFLHRLTPEILKHCLFPIGEYKKDQVRKMAEKLDLPVFAKRDSQEICFVPEKTPEEFLKRYLKLKPGAIVTTEGKIIGQHEGIALYTIGQRKGLEMSGGPWYVVDLNFKNNLVIVADSNEHPALFNDIMYVKDVNWLQKVKLPAKLEVRIRYLHKGNLGEIKELKTGLYEVKFESKQRAITPGQSAVFYKDGEVLGGGLIIKKLSEM
ncbi:MAG: tRNA 2-thiouridine(34) synthase MnmA [Candidatus Parcubacteria bacterium]|nr:tRNA 2-thiouridine(34) synthase MnmA [Candidatus Parcubacteria bacterium]